MNTYEIALHLLEAMIAKDSISLDQFPNAKTYTDAVCEAYKQIFQTVNNARG